MTGKESILLTPVTLALSIGLNTEQVLSKYLLNKRSSVCILYFVCFMIISLL